MRTNKTTEIVIARILYHKYSKLFYTDCPYGDRLPLWCVLQILRSPRTICISHDDLCCESCQYVGPSTTRSSVLLLRRKPTVWEKIKKEHKKKGDKKGKKSKRKDKKSKGKKGKGKGKKNGRRH